MRHRTKVNVWLDISYDAEFAGSQVNLIDFYAVEPDGSFASTLGTLPRDAKLQIINQLVTDFRDKDMMKQNSLENFDPFEFLDEVDEKKEVSK